MALTVVQQASSPTYIPAGGSATKTAAFGSNVTSGNLLAVFVFNAALWGYSTPTDTVGTSYTLGPTTSIAGCGIGWIFYGKAPSSGANTFSITLGGTTGDSQIWPLEISGEATTSPLDVSQSSAGTSLTPTTGTTPATTVANELAVAFLVTSQADTAGLQSGWSGFNDSSGSGISGCYKTIASSGTTVSNICPQTPTGPYIGLIATFLPGAGVTDLNATVTLAPDTVLSFTAQLALKTPVAMLPGTSLTIGGTLTEPDFAALAPATIQTFNPGVLEQMTAGTPIQILLSVTANVTGPTLLSGANAPTPSIVVTPKLKNIHSPQIYI